MAFDESLKKDELYEAPDLDRPEPGQIIASEDAGLDPVLLAKMKLVNDVCRCTTSEDIFVS